MKLLKRLWKLFWASKQQRKLWKLQDLNERGRSTIALLLSAKIGIKPDDPVDTKIYNLKQWVMHNIAYETDLEQFHKVERWQGPIETLLHGAGDCEDLNGLLLCFLNYAGIDARQLRLALGWVLSKSGKRSYHAYGLYEYEKGNWRILDTTFLVLDKDTNLFRDSRYCYNMYYEIPDKLLTLKM